jgi:gas vesicle protein
MAERQMQPNNVVLVSLLAGLTGAAVALLFAPRSGRETREKLHEAKEDMKQQAREGLESAKKTVGTGIDQAKELKNQFVSSLKQTGKRAQREDDNQRDNMAEQTERPHSPVLNNWEEES